MKGTQHERGNRTVCARALTRLLAASAMRDRDGEREVPLPPAAPPTLKELAELTLVKLVERAVRHMGTGPGR